MKCKFYSEEIGKCLFDGPPDDCIFENKQEDCGCFRPIEYEKERIKYMKCKFCLISPSGTSSRCLNPSCSLKKCWFTGAPNECGCFEPKRIEYGSSDAYNDELEGNTIELPKYSARISIGNFQINLTDKTFTEEQIENMKEMLGWEVENL